MATALLRITGYSKIKVKHYFYRNLPNLGVQISKGSLGYADLNHTLC